MTEGNVFTLSTISGEGVPVPGLDGGGGYPIPGLGGGYPIPGLDGGGEEGVPRVPPQPGLDGAGGTHLRSGWWGGTWGPPTMTGWGIPHHDWMGYSSP